MVIFLKMVNILNKLLLLLLSLLFAFIVIVVFLQVLSRYVITIPILWSEEVARYGSIFIVFIVSGIALRRKELIAIDVIFEVLKSEKAKAILETFIDIAAIVFSLVLIVKGYEFLGQVSSQVTPTLQVSMSIPYSAIIIGSVVMLLNGIAAIVERLIGKEID
ncbi:TRAP transporter small permease [Planococcus salinus]|uniref:TRAP transporter small permease n=1 Tax=Planococcus salinus TaxID=1848460 RepID=A0A3M8P7X9_9BACL|nr:TRAP transporter small permease [Planococcus salinus]RNF39785.1 TRAP transporter small permease [Planococcus salinus]